MVFHHPFFYISVSCNSAPKIKVLKSDKGTGMDQHTMDKIVYSLIMLPDYSKGLAYVPAFTTERGVASAVEKLLLISYPLV